MNQLRCPHCGGKPLRWTPVDVQALRDGWERGLTSGQLVRTLGGKFTRSAILGKLGRLKLQRRTH